MWKIRGEKKDPSGESLIDDEVVESLADKVAPCYSATAWSVRRHCIRPLSVAIVNMDAQEGKKKELINLPTLHRKASKAEMFDDRKSSLASNALERTAFFRIAHD